MDDNKIQLFENKRIRTAWDEEKEEWLFLSLMLLKFIQSIPSPKAELFKLWLARVGSERIGETIDPELTIERALETYLKKDIPASGSTSVYRPFKSVKN